ncbi:hypothetical protein NUW58_g6969 [Xylaria curta]|uniref:Uncharacterized protein n=1 Tax=Xylaria curta TaxID=42375 RepID=A0ACC1NN47_9PEZI|nr:hypothetical protein NUW58_g6969 [Xylaria curta]
METPPGTSASSETSVTVSDLASGFRGELEIYDRQLQSLQEGQWPTPPSPRAKALRGSQFSQRTATEIKRWSLVEGMLYGGQSATLRDSDRLHPVQSYEVGVIFSAPYHTASALDERWVSVDDPYNTATPFGIVYSKYRKMVVIKVFGEHCICLPIYSHNGQGLSGKTFLTEFVSIRDACNRYPEPPEGLHLMLLAVGNCDLRGKIVAGKSSVKLTEFCSHRYNVPATMEGKLELKKSDSARRLLGLVKLVSE